ncbi:hypothetical protein CDIK_0762, partial [Cucumispora dikerogammari]
VNLITVFEKDFLNIQNDSKHYSFLHLVKKIDAEIGKRNNSSFWFWTQLNSLEVWALAIHKSISNLPEIKSNLNQYLKILDHFRDFSHAVKEFIDYTMFCLKSKMQYQSCQDLIISALKSYGCARDMRFYIAISKKKKEVETKINIVL